MSESRKAVFLSYASQDAEAARRIAEALRAAGVEVWFDQSELRGGDAWDHKIRQQIKECALFVPIISSNTQARAEGYFRLEWRLADQRTHLMGRAKAFLLPVCVDDTKDADADVPDSFLAVQWMRARNGEADAAFCERVKNLLRGSAIVAGVARPELDERADPGPASTRPATTKRPSSWLVPTILGAIAVIAALGFWQPWRAPAGGAVPSPLVAQVWEQLNKAELARAELDVADGFARQVTEAEPRNADAWAAWSQVDSWFVYHNLDASVARREGARAKAARAIQLAPASYEARLAHACQLVRGQGDRAQSLYATEAGELLRTLLKERTDEPRALLTLGILQRNTGDTAGACETFGRLAENPAFAALAWNETGWARFFVRDIAAAEAAMNRSIAIQPYWGNLTLQTFIAQYWSGDLDRAKDALERIPASVRQEDLGVSLAAELFYWRRESEAMLRVLNEVPRDWLQSNSYDGPKAHYVALAHELAGRREAARLHWQRALDLVERRLADQPDSNLLQHWKGHLLVYLGQRPEAEDALRLAREMGPSPDRVFGVGVDRILLGQFDEALAALEKVDGTGALPPTAAAFRLNPRYDPIRDQPRFQAVCAKLESDPRNSRRAASPSAAPAAPLSPAVAPDRKSIAVLPFANRSNRDEDSFFTDGIHDDLLTQISRIKSIKTISRTSVLGYRNTTKNLRQIGEELGVATILEGGVQRAGDQVRINVQLIDARTDTHLWAERYDRKLSAENVFAIQSEIAAAIAAALQAVLTPEEKQQFEQLPTQNLAALEAYFKARSNDGSAVQTANAIANLQRAIALDPDFADAHALIADQYLRQVWTDGLPAAAQVAKAQPHVERALALAPNSSAAHVALGHLRHRQLNAEGAIGAMRRAIELNANNASAFALLGYIQLWVVRDSAAAVQSYRKALELDPLSPLIRHQTAEALAVDGKFDEARVELEGLLQAEQPYVEAVRNYGDLQEYAYFRLDEAIKAYRRAVALDARNPNFVTKLAMAHYRLGDTQAATFWFERALAVSQQSREKGFLAGMLALLRGDREAAVAQFRTVSEDATFRGPSLQFRFRAALDDGRPEAAAAELAALPPVADPITQGNVRNACMRMSLLHAAGRREEADALGDKIVAALPGLTRTGQRGYYGDDAHVHLARGDRERALAALRELSGMGACSADFGTGAPYQQLRDIPEFQALLQLNATRLAEQRANLARWEAAGELAPIPPLPQAAE